jgi:hypothetical protein
MKLFNFFKRAPKYPKESLRSLVLEGVVNVRLTRAIGGATLMYEISAPFPLEHTPGDKGVYLSYPDGSNRTFVSFDSGLTFV